jgi:hypothetical protein
MKLATVTTPLEPAISERARGSSLLVSPAAIRLSASRAEFDLRDVTVSVNGEVFTLGGRYLETIDDIDLGKVGVLDTNIFKKARVDEAALSAYATTRIAESAAGNQDIRIPIDRQSPDVGEYSSRPLVYDLTKYPWVGTFDAAGQPLPPLFSGVSAVPGGAAADYTLSVELTIRSEVFEILGNDVSIQDRYRFTSHKPTMGDYYLSFLAYATFKLTDRSGAVVMDEKTKQAFPVVFGAGAQIYLPVQNKDADGYAKYFRGYDFNVDARSIVDRIVDQIVLVLRPLYRNVNQYVKVDEEQ